MTGGRETKDLKLIDSVIGGWRRVTIKLAAVASDWLGVSGRAILAQLLDGEEGASKLAALPRGRLRSKLPAMQLALAGRRTEHHRWMLRVLHEQLVFVEVQIGKLEAKIQDQVSDYREAIGLCTTIPGASEIAWCFGQTGRDEWSLWMP